MIALNEYKIKSLPEQDRPREKMIKQGAAALTDAELLAILLRTGTKEKSALALAREIVALNQEKLLLLEQSDVVSLCKIKGIGQTKAVTVVAALELGRRVSMSAVSELGTVKTPHDAAKIFVPLLRSEKKEQFYVMLLNIKNKLLGVERISLGTLNSTLAEPRDVFALAMSKNAAALILAHNHPSGDPAPSTDDKSTTRRMIEAGDVLGIKVLDHIIVGAGRYYNFKDEAINEFLAK